MMKKVSILLVLLLAFSVMLPLASCTKYMEAPIINGTNLKEFVIVYDNDSLDYNQRAAEYIKSEASKRYGLNLKMVDDDTAPAAHEIVVGETSRSISASLDAETEGLEFAILSNCGSIALEGDYFIIAAAAYFFMETYASGDGQISTVSEVATVHEPIVKEAKNFILLIGDGMGVYQTKMYEYMDNNCEYSDGEDIFYGYFLPYKGTSRTNNCLGTTTDSAAGATALGCGYKTFNGYVGMNMSGEKVKSLTELAHELGKSTAILSTDKQTGATPSAFLVHVTSRDFTDIITGAIMKHEEEYGTIVDCGYDYYTPRYMGVIEKHVTDALADISSNENGFFMMYEEAYIDKHCDDNDMEKSFDALARFNQVIARVMEFAFYNPETFVLITADHETGGLRPDENGVLSFNTTDHTSADVPVFAYGKGAELFDGENIENIQIAHTIAALMGEENFGNQSEYQSLTKK